MGKTKEEKKHLERVASIGCIVCRNDGRYNIQAWAATEFGIIWEF
ncbi:hypothetical protein [Neisseria polysaccharea]|uniref:Phage associated protein n=1 Tax=Neisseria polysaccharea TaxID=489 RepID=A0ABV1JI68_NEIPO